MKKTIALIISLASLTLTSCGGAMPQMFWDGDDDKAVRSSSVTEKNAEKRAPLDIPPELRAEMEMPAASEVATHADNKLLPKAYAQAVAGKSVSLDARVYPATADKVFSAVVDAMTSLNFPVSSVDSRSGIITTDWIRKGANSSSIATVLGGIVGVGAGNMVQHRYVVRVFRMKSGEKVSTKLEIRVLLQEFIAKHWVNKPPKRKVTLELFSSIEEQLTRMQAIAPIAEEQQLH